MNRRKKLYQMTIDWTADEGQIHPIFVSISCLNCEKYRYTLTIYYFIRQYSRDKVIYMYVIS